MRPRVDIMPSPLTAARSAIIAAMRHTHVPTPAILLVVASVFCFTLLDTIMKFATQRYPLPVLIFARYAVQMVAMLVWLGPSMRFDLLRTKRLPMQIVRALILLLSSLFFISALKTLPLAEATALNYSTPMIVVVMARVFLGERLTPVRIAFVIAGAVGMLLIVRPGQHGLPGRRRLRAARRDVLRRLPDPDAASRPAKIRACCCSIRRSSARW